MFVLIFDGHKVNDSTDVNVAIISSFSSIVWSSFSLNVDHLKMVTENHNDTCTVTTTQGVYISRKRPLFKEEIPGTKITFLQFQRRMNSGGRYMTIVNKNQFILKDETEDKLVYQTLLGDFEAVNGYQSYQEIFNIESGSIFKY